MANGLFYAYSSAYANAMLCLHSCFLFMLLLAPMLLLKLLLVFTFTFSCTCAFSYACYTSICNFMFMSTAHAFMLVHLLMHLHTVKKELSF